MRRTGGGNRSQGRGARKARMREEEVVRRMEEVTPRRFWYEEYGPDGEIEKAVEWRRLAGSRTDFRRVTSPGYAPPKTDWRERGVVPRLGIHPLQEGDSNNGRYADESA